MSSLSPANKSSSPKPYKKLSPTGNLTPLEIGKLQPQAVDVEEAVLGAMMLDRQALNDVFDILRPESFYKYEHTLIYQAIQDLFANSQPVDIITVTAELRKNGVLEQVGGPLYISQLTNRVGSSANIEFHARIVSEKYIKRKLIEVSSQTINGAYDETRDVFDLLDAAERDLFNISEANLSREASKIGDLLSQATAQIEELRLNSSKLSGVGTGFTDLDRITNGFQKSDLIIIAARPGMGKTAFVMSLARNAAVDMQVPVAVFSLEMSSVQLVMRLISSESEIPGDKLRTGKLQEHEWMQVHRKTTALSNAPIYIDDTPGLTTFDLRAKCRRMKSAYDIGLIIIDYLQLMSGGGKEGNREQEISAISRSLKSLAKELNIPVIALSQLSRAVETRGGEKKPMLSDLRESGSIEQDADQVMFIYRPEYYDIRQDENGNSTEGTGQIIIAKNRHGAVDTVTLGYVKEFAQFRDLDKMSAMGSFTYGSGGGDSGGFSNAGFRNAITKSSRMNEGDDFGPGGEPAF